jgi:hypothetical protein
MKIVNGAIPDEKDSRDYTFEALGTPPLTDEEWRDGFNIESIIGYTIPVKHQYQSYSCVGQAYSTYRGVLQSISERRYREVSAKSIYSLISIGFNQGAYLRDGAKLLKDLGAMWENLCKSYRNGTTDETWMTDKSWFTEEIKDIMALLKTHDYYRGTGFQMDDFARAIRDGYGMVSGISGNNNGTWTSKEPKPPTNPNAPTWGHALFFGKFGVDEKGKYIEALNSWGNVGNNGWQKLREEWFTPEGLWTFTPWILINKTNINTMNETIKVLKDKNSAAVGFWLPAISEDVAKSYALNFGIQIPMKDGNIDWEKFIQGLIEFKN